MTSADWFGLLAMVVIGLAVISVAVAVVARRRGLADEAALADQVLRMARSELDSHKARISSLEASRDDQERGRREDRRRISVLEEQLVAYWRGTQILIAQLVRNGQRPEWEPPARGIGDLLRASPAIDGLYECLRTKFSLSEMEIVAHDAGLNWEQSGATGLPVQVAALRLYEHAERLGRLDALAGAVEKARPGASV